MKINVIQTSTDSNHIAKQIAKKLIKLKYSPCVHIIPNITSIYKWNNNLEETNEILILIKSTDNNVNKCKEIILGMGKIISLVFPSWHFFSLIKHENGRLSRLNELSYTRIDPRGELCSKDFESSHG